MNIALTPTQLQLTKFAAVGFTANFILYGLYLLLTAVALQPHAAMTITYAVAVTFTYLMNRNWTFEYRGQRRAPLQRYVLIYALGYAINFLVLSVMVDRLGYPHEFVQAGLILFLAIVLFVAQKFWVFDKSGTADVSARRALKLRIPFNKSFYTGRELQYIKDVLKNHSTSGDGLYTTKCQDLMREVFSARKVLLTTSCTSALEMSVLLCDLQVGDEVILPSFTFVSTANALALRGIVPRFVDIRRDTKNLDEELVDAAITEKTKAIIPVHYAGVSCDMDAILSLATRYDLRVIEDAAQGVNATYKGAFLGTLGDLGAYSFHETKNYSSGEGGAILINDEALVERAEIIREKGTDRSRFDRGQVDKYSWVDIGSSYLPSDILAACLYAQLEQLDEISAQRGRLVELYTARLQSLADEGFIELPSIPDDCRTNYHMMYILVQDQDARSSLIDHLKSNGVLAVFHYVPLHNSPMGRQLGCDQTELPVTQSVSERLLRLPLYCGLAESDVEFVCDLVDEFLRKN